MCYCAMNNNIYHVVVHRKMTNYVILVLINGILNALITKIYKFSSDFVIFIINTI